MPEPEMNLLRGKERRQIVGTRGKRVKRNNNKDASKFYIKPEVKNRTDLSFLVRNFGSCAGPALSLYANDFTFDAVCSARVRSRPENSIRSDKNPSKIPCTAYKISSR